METLIVRTGSRSKMEALKAFLAALKIDFRSENGEQALIKNPETLRRIALYENGGEVPQVHTISEIRQRLND